MGVVLFGKKRAWLRLTQDSGYGRSRAEEGPHCPLSLRAWVGLGWYRMVVVQGIYFWGSVN